MRLGVFLLFLAFALATASPPAAAQVPSFPFPSPDVVKADKETKKAVKEAIKAIKAALKDDDDDDDDDDDHSGPGGGGDDDDGPGDDDHGGPGDDDEPDDGVNVPGDEDDPGDDEEPVDDGAPGAPAPGGTGGGPGDDQSAGVGGSGGQDPVRSAPSTDASDEGQNSSVGDQACTEECGSPEDVAAKDQGDSILAAESGGQFQAASRALSYSQAPDTGPGVTALFALIVLGLLVGVFGGVRALRGRLRA